MARGKNRCYVCFKKHERRYSSAFPKDFPYKFRWCCRCNSLAGSITKVGLQKNIAFYKKYRDGLKRVHFIRRAKILNKLIDVI